MESYKQKLRIAEIDIKIFYSESKEGIYPIIQKVPIQQVVIW